MDKQRAAKESAASCCRSSEIFARNLRSDVRRFERATFATFIVSFTGKASSMLTYQPRVPSLVCDLEPIGSGGDEWNRIRLSAVTDVHNNSDHIIPGVRIRLKGIPNQITSTAEDTMTG